MQIYLFVYIDILLLAEITMEIVSVGTAQYRQTKPMLKISSNKIIIPRGTRTPLKIIN